MDDIEIKISGRLVDYESSIKFMQSRVKQIHNNNQNELLWFLNHGHIYTQGTSANESEIIKTSDVKIIKSNRGGKTTYHGPGQRIIYFIINLNNKKKDIRKFISIIEDSVITFLANYNVEARSFKERVGIWVIKNNKMTLERERKISAIGLRVKKWITYHGMSFNINPDLKYYNYIHSCGLKDYTNTSLNELGIQIDQDELNNRKKLLEAALTTLNQRECEIITKRRLMDDPLTLEELSGEYSVSRERIRQIEVRAFEKLQKKMCELAQLAVV